MWSQMPTSQSTRVKISDSINNSISSKFYRSVELIKHYWNRKLYYEACKLGSILGSLASVIILWSEFILVTHFKSPIGYILEYANGRHVGNTSLIQFIAFLALSYMSLTTYWSLFKFNLGSYSLQGPKQTTSESLIKNGIYFTRLQFTLGYNFLIIVNNKK